MLDAPARLEAVVAKMLARNPDDRYQTPLEAAEALAPFAMGTKDQWDEDSEIDLPNVSQESDVLTATGDLTLQEFFNNLNTASEDFDSLADTRRQGVTPPETTGLSGTFEPVEKKPFHKTPLAWMIGAASVLSLLILAGNFGFSGNNTVTPPNGSSQTTPPDDTDFPLIVPLHNNDPPESKTDGKKFRSLKGHAGKVHALAASADGRTLASSGEIYLRLWDANPFDRLNILEKNPDQPKNERQVHALAFRPDSVELAAGGTDFGIKLWSLGHKSVRMTLKEHQAPITDICYSRDSRLLASADSSGVLKMWNVAIGESRWTITAKQPILCLAFHPTQTLLATGHPDGTVTLWDGETGMERKSWPAHTSEVLTIQFNPAYNDLLATGGKDAKAHLWDINSLTLRTTMSGENNPINTLSFSPNGKILALATRGILLFEIPTGEFRNSLTASSLEHQVVVFSADGTRIFGGDSEGEIHSWPLPNKPSPPKTITPELPPTISPPDKSPPTKTSPPAKTSPSNKTPPSSKSTPAEKGKPDEKGTPVEKDAPAEKGVPSAKTTTSAPPKSDTPNNPPADSKK